MFSYSLKLTDNKVRRLPEGIFDLFAGIDMESVERNCLEYQRLKREKNELSNKGDVEGAEKKGEEIYQLKQRHPVFCFLGTYRDNERASANLEPNGLFFIDIDYKDNVEKLKDGPRELDKWIREQDTEYYDKNVVLAHVSWSGTGLRYVVKADHSMSYLENCEAFVEKYGLAKDESCKDLARASFVPTRDFIINVSDELFTYHNPLTNAEFGGSNEDSSVRLWYDRGMSKVSASRSRSSKVTSIACAQGSMKEVERDKEGEPLYQGKIRFRDIAAKLMELLGGVPQYGDRAVRVYQWGKHFRFICDNDVNFMMEMVRDLSGGLSDEELRHQLESSVKYDRGLGISKMMRRAIGKIDANGANVNADLLDTKYWNDRLDAIQLPKGMRESVLGVPYSLRPGAVEAILPCIYTLLSRVSAIYCNHTVIRMNGMAMWVGDSTIGKSHLKNVCQLWMKQLKNQDNANRAIEAKWRQEKERLNESKVMREARPQPVIRYIPSNVSTSQLATRLMNAKEQVPTLNEDGSAGPCVEMPLHLITIEPDMVSMELALKREYSNHISYAMKSFDNEDAGQDFKNDTSTNGAVPVCWNQSWAGTWNSFRKMMCPNVGSGIEYRMMIFPAPTNYFQMEENNSFFDHPEWTKIIEEVAEIIGGKNPFWGTMYCPNLNNAMNEWCEEKMEQAKEENDTFLDIIRRRDRQKGFLAGLAFAILERREDFFNLPVKKLKNGMVVRYLKVSNRAIKFARFVADLCVAGELATLREEVMLKLESEKQRGYQGAKSFKMYSDSSVAQFNLLPDEFTMQEAMDLFPDMKIETLRSKIKRWREDGFLQRDAMTKKLVKVKRSLA